MASKRRGLRRSARPRFTPRGKDGRTYTVFIDAIVSRHVPTARIDACLADHRSGVRVRLSHPWLKEPVFKTACIHHVTTGKSFEWWVVSFPKQRKTFLGPPEFFAKFFPPSQET